MKLDLRTAYDADADDVAAAYADPALYAELGDLPKLGGAEVVDHSVTGDVVRLSVRWRFVGELSSSVTAVVDRRKLSWIEEDEHRLDRREVRWRLLPDHYADRLRASGTYTFLAANRGGAVRATEGEVKVRMPLVGGRVEAALVSGLGEHLADEVPIVERWIADRG